MQIADPSRHLCALAKHGGRTEICAGAECPLWERGACALEQLTAGQLYLDEWPDDEPD